MKLGPHGKRLVDFLTAYVDGNMERFDFDMDYSGYVIAHFPGFEAETPQLAAKFANTIDGAYSTCGQLRDDAFHGSFPLPWMTSLEQPGYWILIDLKLNAVLLTASPVYTRLAVSMPAPALLDAYDSMAYNIESCFLK